MFVSYTVIHLQPQNNEKKAKTHPKKIAILTLSIFSLEGFWGLLQAYIGIASVDPGRTER
jgi:uncharacterized cupin superfamily protein